MFKTEHKSLRVKAGKNRYFVKAFNEVTTTKKAQVFRHISVLLFSIETPLHFLFFSFSNIGSFLYRSSCGNILSY